MGFKKYSLLIALRTTFMLIAIALLVTLLITPGYHAASLLCFFILLALLYEFSSFTTKTNMELTRFLDAARYADFSQRFHMHDLGSGFGELGEAFTDILARFQDVRAGQEKELRRLKALVEHVPVPLMSLHDDDDVTLWNNAARRLFGTARLSKLSDLDQFGSTIKQDIDTLPAGERRLVLFEQDGSEQRLTIAATQIIVDGRSEKLISLQDIQSELDVAQLQAWQDLVSVLTHEIMNSITPVASLAKTSVDLVHDVQSKVSDLSDASDDSATKKEDLIEELSDVADAVKTVSRRSDALMNFVTSYRRLTRLPPPQREPILFETLIQQVTAITCQNWDKLGIDYSIKLEPPSLDANLDLSMIEQVVINLLKNAEQALLEHKQRRADFCPSVKITGHLNRRGRPVLIIEDNGPGIPKDIVHNIFVPFFTTKREGSGVGLALTRQVMIAHGGSVKVDNIKTGGASFTLTF